MLDTLARRSLAAATGLLLCASGAGATTLVQMNLKDLASRADKVFRGRVVGVDSATVRVGGGELPATVYRLRVEEGFKGRFEGRGGALVELRMLSRSKAARDSSSASGSPRRVPVLPDVPELAMGREYVLFTTRPSAVGLSTTVGLGQGAFTVLGAGKGGDTETAVNAFGNRGLTRGLDRTLLPSRGPLPYAELARAIRAVLNQ
jgi:hypothetical protein